jgi:predicted amidohydrolase
MKVSVAQTRPFKGDIEKNIDCHKRLINLAIHYKAAIIIFPELSLTGYEPVLAKDLATTEDDDRFDVFQTLSDTSRITICVGMPMKNEASVMISMLIFSPRQPRQVYSKQYLHDDEVPYFVPGHSQVILNIDDLRIAPSICYESLVPEHAERAFEFGAEIYVASVAKAVAGVEKAARYFPEIVEKYFRFVLMANCVGMCDGFETVGKTSVWNNKGRLVAQLNSTNEGLLVLDTDTFEIVEKIVIS